MENCKEVETRSHQNRMHFCSLTENNKFKFSQFLHSNLTNGNGFAILRGKKTPPQRERNA